MLGLKRVSLGHLGLYRVLGLGIEGLVFQDLVHSAL